MFTCHKIENFLESTEKNMGPKEVWRAIGKPSRIFPIYHITDNMGVSFTLLQGTTQGILFDAGYGLEDVRAYVDSLAGVPYRLILSHGHHDHVLGARWFEECFMAREDGQEFLLRTGRPQRQRVQAQAEAKGLPVPTDFLTVSYPMPRPLAFDESFAGFESCRLDLGGIQLLLFRVPGHTPGSVMGYVPEYRLLLSGDNWNPCTWLWFPCSEPVRVWRSNMLRVLDSLEIDQVLCPHQPSPRPGEEFRRYVLSLTDERLKQAKKTPLDPEIATYTAFPDGEKMVFVFDWNKFC